VFHDRVVGRGDLVVLAFLRPELGGDVLGAAFLFLDIADPAFVHDVGFIGLIAAAYALSHDIRLPVLFM
jgi:hypothetical protein